MASVMNNRIDMEASLAIDSATQILVQHAGEGSLAKIRSQPDWEKSHVLTRLRSDGATREITQRPVRTEGWDMTREIAWVANLIASRGSG